MSLDIMNDEYWERLVRGAESIPENWNRKSEEAIRIEKREVEKKYGIRLGRTEISCNRCGRLYGFEHLCRDLYLQRLREEKERAKALKNETKTDVVGKSTHTEYIKASAPQF
jgi:hypothetical protein